jgi:hypothetical protein
VLVEGLPGALQQQVIASGQSDRLWPEILAAALHGEHHQIAVAGDHPREHRPTDQLGTNRDHDFGKAG